MSWQEIAAEVDAWIVPRLSAGQAMQADYFAAHGRYWQGVAPIDAPPSDGAAVPGDPSRRPTDQPESWQDVGADAFLSSAGLQSRPTIDVADGPDGHGWRLTVSFRCDGVLHARRWGFGSLADRSHGWMAIEEGL